MKTKKEFIEEHIMDAYNILKESEIVDKDNKNKIDKSYRSQMSAFGVIVIMGTLKAAVSDYSDENSHSNLNKKIIIECIWKLMKKYDNYKDSKYNSLQECMKNNQCNKEQLKEDVLNAATTLKYAMNLFELY